MSESAGDGSSSGVKAGSPSCCLPGLCRLVPINISSSAVQFGEEKSSLVFSNTETCTLCWTA